MDGTAMLAQTFHRKFFDKSIVLVMKTNFFYRSSMFFDFHFFKSGFENLRVGQNVTFAMDGTHPAVVEGGA